MSRTELCKEVEQVRTGNALMVQEDATWMRRSDTKRAPSSSAQRERAQMQLRSKEPKKPQMRRMINDAAVVMSIAKPALPLRINLQVAQVVCSAVDVQIGFALLALAGKSMAILPTDAWNPKCIRTSKRHWIHCGKNVRSRGIASNAGKTKSLKMQHLHIGLIARSGKKDILPWG